MCQVLFGCRLEKSPAFHPIDSRAIAIEIVASSKTMWTLTWLWAQRTRPQRHFDNCTDRSFPQRPHQSCFLKKTEERSEPGNVPPHGSSRTCGTRNISHVVVGCLENVQSTPMLPGLRAAQ